MIATTKNDAKDLFSLGLVRNYPISTGRKQFESGYYHPTITYQRKVSEEWFMGFGMQFKHLYRKTNQNDQPIFTIGHVSQYVLGLSRDYAFTFASKLLYLMPVRVADFPFRKESEHEPEIGWSIGLGLRFRLSLNHFLTLHVNRWRGTKTLKFQGLEAGISTSVLL